MLDSIRELRESITQPQREAIGKILSEKEMAALGSVLSSTNDPKKAESAVDRFKEILEENKIAGLRLWNNLEGRQREIIQNLIE